MAKVKASSPKGLLPQDEQEDCNVLARTNLEGKFKDTFTSIELSNGEKLDVGISHALAQKLQSIGDMSERLESFTQEQNFFEGESLISSGQKAIASLREKTSENKQNVLLINQALNELQEQITNLQKEQQNLQQTAKKDRLEFVKNTNDLQNLSSEAITYMHELDKQVQMLGQQMQEIQNNLHQMPLQTIENKPKTTQTTQLNLFQILVFIAIFFGGAVTVLAIICASIYAVML